MIIRSTVVNPRTARPLFRLSAVGLLLAAAASSVYAGYEVPNASWNAPAAYYNAAAGTGLTLRANLKTIISTGFVERTYGDQRYAMGTGDGSIPGGNEFLDPNNSANIRLVYNDASILGQWDAGATWNREHVWPKSLLNLTSNQVSNTYHGVASDSFELMPSNPGVNSGRLNWGYGYYPQVGPNGSTHYGTFSAGGGTFFYPGDNDIGDVSRSIFYMATRYFDAANSSRGTSAANLEIVNGPASTYNFGDLNSLLHWNYMDGVDNFERRRNQYIYSSSLNPTYYQGNRNPFIDRPEYVWAIYGTHKSGTTIINDSQIFVTANPTTDGSSTTTVDLGRVIKGAAIPTSTTTFRKVGADPTTFDVSATGLTTTAASDVQIGTGQPMPFGSAVSFQTRTLTYNLTASTATAGLKTGTVTINNTDLTTSGTGRGSADGNDTITINATVVDHANGSFSADNNVDSYTSGFDYVPVGFVRTKMFNIGNVQAQSGYTAQLALNSVATTGSSVFSNNVSTADKIAGGASKTYTVSLDSSTPGDYAATTTVNVGDEAIPGATPNATPLVFNTSASIIAHGDFNHTGSFFMRVGETFSTGPSSIGAGVQLFMTGGGTLNIDGPQDNGVGSRLWSSGGTSKIIMGTDGGPNLEVIMVGAGLLQVRSPQHLKSITVENGNPQADLANYPVTMDETDGETLRQALATGAIFTTTPDPDDDLSIGYIPAGATGYTLQLTYTGDANLNGIIDSDDYALLDRGFHKSLAGWVNGDFNYDNLINTDDFLLLDRSFALQSPLSASFLAEREAQFGDAYVSALLTSIPEPGSIGLIIAAMAGIARRRR